MSAKTAIKIYMPLTPSPPDPRSIKIPYRPQKTIFGLIRYRVFFLCKTLEEKRGNIISRFDDYIKRDVKNSEATNIYNHGPHGVMT